MKNFEVIEHKTMFSGYIMDVYQDKIRFENGLEANREWLHKRHEASAIAAIDPEGKMLFVEQYRYGTDQDMLEVPAGLVDPGEDPKTCAERELEEETGWKSGKTTFLFEFYVSPGYCSEKIYMYLCEDLSPSHQHLDADEFLKVKRFTCEEAVKLIEEGKITDGKTIALIYALKAKGF